MRRTAGRIALWLMALGWLVFSLYLSWQTGNGTVGLSMKLAQSLLKLLVLCKN